MNSLAEYSVWVSGMLIVLHVSFLLYILYRKTGDAMSTAFWLTLAAVFPLGGFVLFLFFGVPGRKRMEFQIAAISSRLRYRAGRQQMLTSAVEQLDRALNKFISDGPADGTDRNLMLDRLFPEAPLLSGNHTELLVDGTEAYPRMLEDICNAKVSIRLQSFILMGDSTGLQFLEALEAKAAEGVDVKVMYDSFGSFKSLFSKRFRRLLRIRQANMEIRAFSQLNLFAPWLFQMRNHRKLLVIDGRIAYTGGINISEENERREDVPANRYIHDLHCRITGPAVSQLAMTFFRDWAYIHRKNPGRFTVPGELALPENCGEDALRVIPSGPGNCYQGTKELFYTAAMQARKSLTILTPYFVPGTHYVELLCMTAARGVEVQIIVPKNNNHLFVDLAARSMYGRLLEYGVRIYEKKGNFSHIKALLGDGAWGFMGSSNCDNRSFRLNYELDFWFDGGPAAEALDFEIHQELQNCDEVTLQDTDRKGILSRLAENTCALLSPIL